VVGCTATTREPGGSTFGMFVRAGQPLAQVLRGLVWCPSIEGHQSGGHTRDLHDLCAPPVGAERRHLDQVRTPANDFFEAMNDQGVSEKAEEKLNRGSDVNRTPFYKPGACDQAKGRTKTARPHFGGTIFAESAKKNISVSAHAQEMHATYTVFPQGGRALPGTARVLL
jgi:hypothetical protein